MKRSERSAVWRACAYLRCPSCNRQGVSVVTFEPMTAGCGRCGWQGPFKASFEDHPERFQKVATVAVSS